MNDVEDIVELSENDDDDDCILESVIYEEAKLNKIVNDENRLLTEFIETCLNLENSEEMYRVINRTLLKKYRKTDASFKQSQVLNKALRRAINLVKTEPSLKYTHIKDLCEILKSSNTKKRVQFTTLTNITKENKLPSLSCKRKSENARNSKKQKIDIIDLDLCEDVTTNSLVEASDENGICGRVKENIQLCSPSKNTDENKLLVPHIEIQFNGNVCSNFNEEISKIEEEIAYCKRAIAELDEKEVCIDTRYSPYVKCEWFKARILFLYKKLCHLTGEVPVRRSTIRLKVRDGHPAGPVRILEEFINRNVGNDGNPMFPNFRDVVKCVLKANERDNLGWSKQQIMKEASALFTHCGRALQRRRQRREWRDLLSKVKVELCEDPADSDPALLARLEANRRDAVKKEKAILERFSRMQNMPLQRDKAVCSQVRDDDESSNSGITSSSDESENGQFPNYMLGQKPTSNEIHKDDIYVNNNITVGNTDDEASDLCMIKVKTEPELNLNQILDELGDNYTPVVEIEDQFVIEISDSSSEDSE